MDSLMPPPPSVNPRLVRAFGSSSPLSQAPSSSKTTFTASLTRPLLHASSSKHRQQSMQSIDAILYRDAALHQHVPDGSRQSSSRPTRQQAPGTVKELVDDSKGSDGEFVAFDKLMEAYELACEDADFGTLVALPLPADPDDIWCEIEDSVIRNAQWSYLQRLMQKFGKHFDTDFLAEIITSNYMDEHKVCVLEIALRAGWKIDSPKSDGGHILCDALENDTDVVLGCLLHYNANPNLFSENLTLDAEEPLLTSIGSPLQDALEFGTAQQVHMLLHYGARPDLANGIHTAIRSDEHESLKIKLLLQHGANKHAVEWAGNPVMSALLQQNGMEPVAPITLAYSLGKAHVVQFLLDTSVDPDALPYKPKPLSGMRSARKDKLRLRKERLSKARLTGNDKARDRSHSPLRLREKAGVLNSMSQKPRASAGVRGSGIRAK